MKVLIISKPTYNIVLPTDKFLTEGTKCNISDKYEFSGGIGVYVASLLGKWGIPCSFTGVVGGDDYGSKIKKDLEARGVDTKFIEVNYEKKTTLNYIVSNKTNGSSTQIIQDNGVELTKYKYDFIPDMIVMDGTDMAGALAAMNNFPKAISILFANKVNEQYYDLSKRCKYVVANMTFAKALTKLEFEFNKPKNLVNFYQKIKDLNKANYTLMLRDNGVMYSSSNQVKMIPAIHVQKTDDTNAGGIFLGAFCYGVINGYDMDVTAKIANIAAGLSLTKYGLDGIPVKSEVFSMAGIKEVSDENEILNDTTSEEVTTNANQG